MEVWRIVLYCVAAALALRTLAALMTAHKRRLQQEIIAQQERLLDEQRQALAESTPKQPAAPNRAKANGSAA